MAEERVYFIKVGEKPLPTGGGCKPTPLRPAIDFKIALVSELKSFRGLGPAGSDEMPVERFGLPSSVKQQPLFVLAIMRTSNNLEGFGENQAEATFVNFSLLLSVSVYKNHH